MHKPGNIHPLGLIIVAAALTLAVAVFAQSRAFQREDSTLTIKQLSREIARLEGRKSRFNAEVYRRLMPLAKLKLEIARLLDENRSWWNQGKVKRTIQEGQDALERLKRGELPSIDEQRSKRNEWAYVTPTDGSIQPWYLFVPTRYDPGKPTPLVVFLHGWVPTTSKADPWVPGMDTLSVADDHNVLFLVPYGRRNSDFQGVGEVDVLDTIEETKRYYNVDTARIYLMGTSMGGFGTWLIGAHYPDLFAAIAPISGQSDYFVWYDLDRERLPGWKHDMIAMFNPLDLAENALNLPAYCQHGAIDPLVPVKHSRIMVRRLRELGYHVEYYEEEGTGHYIYWDKECYKRALNFLLQHKLDRYPKRVVYKTYTLKYNRAYWVTIDELEQWGQPAKVDARVGDDGAVSVTTENVAALTLDLPPGLVGQRESVRVTINGNAQEKALPADRKLHLRLVNGEGGVLRKTHEICGPARDAFNTPFIVVYGTTGPEERDKENERKANRFVREWKAFADGEPTVKTDSEVTAEDIETKNLMLFGRPGDNSILARIADRLPIKIDDAGVEAAGKRFEGENVGLWMIYPNPENPKRYVLVVSGYFWGEYVSDAHRYDLIPDFIIFDDRKERDPHLTTGPYRMEIPTNHALCAGFFDKNWRIDEELTWLAQ